MNPVPKIGNDKRKASCKKVGGIVKKVGHKREKDFLRKYNPSEVDKQIEYGATADTSICSQHEVCSRLEANKILTIYLLAIKAQKIFN